MRGRDRNNLDFDTVVIGAGIGGLVCADLLASKGRRVALIEQHDLPGGYCSSFKREGFVFDTVVDTIGGLDERGVFGAILRRLGLADRLGTLRLDPIRENLFGTRTVTVPADLGQYREELIRNFPKEKKPIRAFLKLLQRLFTEIRSLPMREVYDGEVSPELAAVRGQTWQEFALAHVSDRLQDVLAERACFLGLPPSKVSAISLISMLMNYFDGGAYRIRGGHQKLADLLAEDLRSRGGTVRLATPVESILIRNGEAVGVRVRDGEEISARDVVSNGDIRRTTRDLIGPMHLSAEVRASVDSMNASLSFVVIHLGLSAAPGGLFRGTSIGYYPGGSVEKTFGYRRERIQEKDIFIGVGLPSLADDSLAPPGKHVAIIHHPVPADLFDDWKKDAPVIADAILGRLEPLFPGLRDSIEVRSIATPPTLERYTWNEQGVAYGWEATPARWPSLGRMQEGLPDHLFQVGHWADYGGGTASAAVSGYEVARRILKGWIHQVKGTQHVR